MKALSYLLALCWLGILSAFSETLVLRSGNTVEGTVIRTNGGEFLLLTDFGTFNFAEASIKEIRKGAAGKTQKIGRLPNFRSTVFSLNQQAWVSTLTQIPATVIDKGVFKNVPYVSFQCNDDYEVNVYGDLAAPAAIEVGLYRKLLGNDEAQSNCRKFIIGLLSQADDKEIVQSLNSTKDIKERAGLSFEITPPDAEDAYLGWWISVYSEDKLNRSRASEKEVASISVPKAITTEIENGSVWSADEMKLARTQPETITFVTSSGYTISNAVVVRVIDGAYLVWRQGASGGQLKLSDLPEYVRNRFNFDESKAAGVYAANEQKKKEAQAQSLAAQAAQARPAVASVAEQGDYGSSGGSSSSYVPSSGGRVYVRGYTRKDGTYVQPHTRRR